MAPGTPWPRLLGGVRWPRIRPSCPDPCQEGRATTGARTPTTEWANDQASGECSRLTTGAPLRRGARVGASQHDGVDVFALPLASRFHGGVVWAGVGELKSAPDLG